MFHLIFLFFTLFSHNNIEGYSLTIQFAYLHKSCSSSSFSYFTSSLALPESVIVRIINHNLVELYVHHVLVYGVVIISIYYLSLFIISVYDASTDKFGSSLMLYFRVCYCCILCNKNFISKLDFVVPSE